MKAKRSVSANGVRFTLEKNMNNELCIFADLYGHSTTAYYTHAGRLALIRGLKQALPVLETWTVKLRKIPPLR